MYQKFVHGDETLLISLIAIFLIMQSKQAQKSTINLTAYGTDNKSRGRDNGCGMQDSELKI